MIIKSTELLAGIVGGGFSAISTWPIMTAKVGYTPRNAFVNVTALTWSLWKHYFLNLVIGEIVPAAVIAGIPIPSVDELSHGISDREVRYRANGGIFLAHQHGGNESLRIVGRAWGTSRFLFLNMLDLLFLWGSDKTIDVFKEATSSISELNIASTPPSATTGSAAKRLEDIDRDPWKKFNKSNLNEGYHEQHMTFPVITKDRVYISMYIETFSWRQRLDKEGRKMVEYTIFFRKYEPQQEYKRGFIKIPKRKSGTKRVEVYKQKTISSPMIYSGWKATVEIIATIAIHPEMFNVGNITNFGQQFVMNYFGSGELDDRIPGIIEQRFFG